jgi:hypothetical protein
MRKEYSDYEEDEALIQLSEEELQKFLRVAEAYLTHSANIEVELAFTSNVGALLENIKKIRYSYYDNLPELLGKVLAILEKIQSETKDTNIKSLVEEAISEVKSFYSRFNLPYEKYYYSYKYPYYKYPYSKEDKVRRAKEIYSEELQKLVSKAKEQEDENLRDMIRDNVLGDLVIQSSSYGDKLPTIVDEYQKRLDWNDLDARLLKIVNEIKSEKEELAKARQEIQQLNKKEIELSASEEKVKELQKKLIEKAVDYIIASGKEQ